MVEMLIALSDPGCFQLALNQRAVTQTEGVTPCIFTSHLGPPIRHSATPIRPPWAQKNNSPQSQLHTHTLSKPGFVLHTHTLDSTLESVELCVYSKCILIVIRRTDRVRLAAVGRVTVMPASPRPSWRSALT